jgi:hypothetical protein
MNLNQLPRKETNGRRERRVIESISEDISKKL